MTDLNEIQFFVQIAKVHSFTLAAKNLGVPKSKISRGLARLEQRLGVRLFERTTRRVVLTGDGEVYLQHCQRALEEAEQADLAVSALRTDPRGRLGVGVPITFLHAFLSFHLADFLARYPELRVHLELRAGHVSLADANLDILIRTGPVDDSGLLVKHLGRGHRSLYASPAYLEKFGAPDTPASLRGHACVTRGETGAGVTLRLHRDGEVEEVRLESRVSVADPVINWRFALAGIGIAMVPQLLAEADEQEGRLIRVLPEWEPDPVDLYAVYPARLDQSPKVRAFLQWLDTKIAPRIR